MNIDAIFEVPVEEFTDENMEHCFTFFCDCMFDLKGSSVANANTLGWNREKMKGFDGAYIEERYLITIKAPRKVMKYVLSAVYRVDADKRFNASEHEYLFSRFANYVYHTHSVTYPLALSVYEDFKKWEGEHPIWI